MYLHTQQREVKRLQDEVKSLEKVKGELSGTLEKEKEMVKSKMAEIEVLKEWDKVSVVHVYYCMYIYLHVELHVFHVCVGYFCVLMLHIGERPGAEKEQG